MKPRPDLAAANAERDAKIRELARLKIPYAQIAQKIGVHISVVRLVMADHDRKKAGAVI